jgi:hypothetical protein
MRYRDSASRDIDSAINLTISLAKLIQAKQVTDTEALNKLSNILTLLESVDEAIKLS